MIIGLTGRIAAGKGVIKDFLLTKGFYYYTVSQIIREEAARLGIPIKRKELQDLGNAIRNKEGGGAWMKRIIEKMDKKEKYVIDGIRNGGEIEELKKLGNFVLISVDAPQELRFERVLKRDKDSDPKDWKGFLEMDNRDFEEEDPLGQQVGKCMEMANFSLVNDSTFEDFEMKIKEVCDEIKCY